MGQYKSGQQAAKTFTKLQASIAASEKAELKGYKKRVRNPYARARARLGRMRRERGLLDKADEEAVIDAVPLEETQFDEVPPPRARAARLRV